MEWTNPGDPAGPPPIDAVSKIIVEESAPESGKVKDLFVKEQRYIIVEKIGNQLEQNRGERVKYARRTFHLTIGWIAAVLVTVVLSGVKHKGGRLLNLSDQVVIVLITTTTFNVFAFFILVMQFLFNKREMETLRFLFGEKGLEEENKEKNKEE